jgi:hypothetical protein
MTKDQALKQLLSTSEGRQKVAASMVVPIRCGGAEYIKGVLHLRLGGCLVPDSVVKEGWPSIRAYQATHEPYVLKPRGRKVV